MLGSNLMLVLSGPWLYRLEAGRGKVLLSGGPPPRNIVIWTGAWGWPVIIGRTVPGPPGTDIPASVARAWVRLEYSLEL